MTNATINRLQTLSRSQRARRCLVVALVAIGVSGGEAWAQDTSTPSAETSPFTVSATPVSDAVVRLTQTGAVSAPRRSPLGDHPVLLGTIIGAAGAGVWQASTCHGSSCNTGTAALVGAGVGAYTGLVVGAVRDAKAGRPVRRSVKIGLAAGAVAAVAGGWLACYGVGGCGGAS